MSNRLPLLIVFLTVFIDLLGFGMILPLLPLYTEQFTSGMSSAAQGWTIGGLMACFSLMQFLFSPFWGRLSDRVGRRPILILGLAGSTFFYFVFGLATWYESLLGMFIARCGAGIAGATIATAQAYIADVTPKEGRAKGMALIGGAFGLGFTFGPLLGAAALSGGNAALSPWPGFVASMLSGCALLLAIFKLPESLNAESRSERHRIFDLSAIKAAIATPTVGLLLVTWFVAVLSFANFESTLSLLLADKRSGFSRDPQHVLYIFAYIGIVLTLAQGVLVRRLATRVHEGTLAAAGAIVQIAGFMLLVYTTNHPQQWMLLLALAVIVTGFALITPSVQGLVSRRSDPAKQGGIMGVGQSVSSLARILGPAFGPRLFTQSATIPLYVASGLMAAAFLLILCSAWSGQDFPGEQGA